jgi:hypothetical protein
MKKPTNRWAKLLAHDKEFVSRTIVAKGELMPMFVAHHRDGTISMFLTPFRDAEHKRMIHEFLKIMVVGADCAGFSLMHEAWVRSVKAKPGQSAQDLMREVERDGPMPSKASDREEVVTVSLVYRDDADERKALTAVGDIVRGADGNVTSVKWSKDAADLIDGAVVNIMPPDPAGQQHRDIAAWMLVNKGPAIMKALGIVEVSA